MVLSSTRSDVADRLAAFIQASVRRPPGQTRDRVGRPVPGRSDGSAVVSQSVAMRERRAALHLARLEPSVGYWLAKQRWLWRHNRCDMLPALETKSLIGCTRLPVAEPQQEFL